MLTRLRHPNLVCIMGMCHEGGQKLGMFEFMPRGSLRELLDKKALSWKDRVVIALGEVQAVLKSGCHCLLGTAGGVLRSGRNCFRGQEEQFLGAIGEGILGPGDGWTHGGIRARRVPRGVYD